MVEIVSRRYEAPRRGPTNSQDFNSMQDLFITDLTKLATALNNNTASIAEALQILVAETRANREEIERLKNKKDLDWIIAARLGEEITYFQDWRRTKYLDFSGVSLANRMRVDTAYGQCTIPFNDLVERFYYRSLETDQVVTNPGVEVEVTAVSEDNAADLVPGTPENAFNGINESYWVREVLYEPKADVEEVSCYIQADVPVAKIMNSNMLVLHPYPTGLVDIVDILYSTDDTAPSLSFGNLLESNPFPINSAGFLRFAYPPTNITKIRVTLRQRAFMNRGGWKSFQYGLQEMALRLVDYDKTDANFDPGTDPVPTNIHSVITTIDAPSGYYFRAIRGFWSNPAYITATGSSESGRHGWPIFYRIYTNAALTIPYRVWYSYDDGLPQDIPVSVSGNGINRLYVVTSAVYDNAESAPPLLDFFGLKFTTES